MITKGASIERRNASLKTFDRVVARLTDDAGKVVAELAAKDYGGISGLLATLDQAVSRTERRTASTQLMVHGRSNTLDESRPDVCERVVCLGDYSSRRRDFGRLGRIHTDEPSLR